MKIDYYYQIHKAIRRLMFNLAITIGTCDYTNKQAIQALQTDIHAFLQLLHDHAKHEDHYFQPFIFTKLSQEATHVTEQHKHHEMQIKQIILLCDSLNDTPITQEKIQELYREFNLFIASYLQHLAYEEHIMTLLWSCSTTDELMQPLQLFLSNFNIEKIKKGICYLLPALNQEERIAYLQHLHSTLGKDDFAQLLNVF